MVDAAETPAEPHVVFETSPEAYRHWTLTTEGPVATLTLAVDPAGGLRDDYELKLNSYDLGVDIELHDVTQRLRFEHPEVKVVVVIGGLDKMFCAGANIQMLAGSSHAHKVNFCKFTNETRNSIGYGSPPSMAPRRAAATNSRSPATRSCSSTIDRQRSRCPRSRCWPCCREPAA